MKIFDTVYDVMKKISKNKIEYKLLKLSEEVGELSQAFLGTVDSVNKSKSSENASVKEEAIDTLLVIIDIISSVMSKEEAVELVSKKIKKFEKKFM